MQHLELVTIKLVLIPLYIYPHLLGTFWASTCQQLIRKVGEMEQLDAELCHLPRPVFNLHFNESHLQGARRNVFWPLHFNMTAIRRHQQLVEGGTRDGEVREGMTD